MSEFKGTPGPWGAIQHSWSRFGIYAADKGIAALDIYSEATEENEEVLGAEMEANALLIATAPELLESLVEIVGYIDREGPASKEWAAISSACERAGLVIRKALGE